MRRGCGVTRPGIDKYDVAGALGDRALRLKGSLQDDHRRRLVNDLTMSTPGPAGGMQRLVRAHRRQPFVDESHRYR